MSLNNTALLKKELEILNKEKEIIISEEEEKNVVEGDTPDHETDSDKSGDDDDEGDYKPFNIPSDDSDDSDGSDDEEDWQEQCDISVYYDKDIPTQFFHTKDLPNDTEAIKAAAEDKYQFVCKLKNGKYYYGYRKTLQSRKTCEQIKRDLSPKKDRTVWVIDYH